MATEHLLISVDAFSNFRSYKDARNVRASGLVQPAVPVFARVPIGLISADMLVMRFIFNYLDCCTQLFVSANIKKPNRKLFDNNATDWSEKLSRVDTRPLRDPYV